jgi:hypothetical protein
MPSPRHERLKDSRIGYVMDEASENEFLYLADTEELVGPMAPSGSASEMFDLSECSIETDNESAYRVLGGLRVNFKNLMARIDANLDDLQSGVEACSRGAAAIHADAASFGKILEQIKGEPLIGSLMRRAADLAATARDQHEVLQELRDGIARLQEELKRSNGAVRPPPAVAADRSDR